MSTWLSLRGSALVLVWSLVAAMGTVSAALAAPATGPRQETAELLEWLGVVEVIEQAPTALDYALAAERRQRDAAARDESAWRRALAGQFNARRLRQQVVDDVVAQRKPALFRHAYALLQQPLPRRLQYFGQAMEERGAAANLRDFLSRLPVLAPPPERRAEIEAIDEALGYSRLVATLQSYAARAAHLEAGAQAQQLAPIADEIAARHAHLRPLLVDYLLYAWRYVKSEELAAYRKLLLEPQVQEVARLGHEALERALAGTLPAAGAN